MAIPETSKNLLQQMLEEAGKLAKQQEGVKPAFALGIKYNAELQRIVKAVKKDIDELLMPVVRRNQSEFVDHQFVMDSYTSEIASVLEVLSNKWGSAAFEAMANGMAAEFVQSANENNRRKTSSKFGIDIYSDSQSMLDFLAASAYDNSQLIKTIPQQYLAQVESVVMSNIRTGNRSSTITKQLASQYGVTKRRAKFIARDQTAKINGQLTKKRQEDAGFQYFQWITSKDSNVRDRHDAIADKVTAYGKGIYRWDFLPLSDSGDPIAPGTDYGCRCTARPVLKSEVERNKERGNVNPSVKR